MAFRHSSTVRAILVGCAVAACSANDASPTDDSDNANELAAQPIDPSKGAALLAKAKGLVRPGSVVQMEPRFGVPTFLWAGNSAGLAASRQALISGSAQPAAAAARAVAADYAPLYGLSAQDLANTVVANVDTRAGGPVLVKLRANRGGIEIFGEELNVVMTRQLDGIALSGYLTSADTPAAKSGGLDFNMSSAAAAAAALGKLAGISVGTAMLVPSGTRDGYDTFALSPSAGIALEDAIRAKQVYFHLPAGLEAAYYVEVIARTGAPPADVLAADGATLASTEAYAYVISAVTGQVLLRKNLTAHASQTSHGNESNLLDPGGFTYRVWADPVTGIPSDTPAGDDVHPKKVALPDGAQEPFVAPADVTLPYFSFSKNDPWLAPGATETNGNNVDAYLNLFSPDGITTSAVPADPPTGDYRAQITAAGQFLHTHTPDGNGALAEGRQGSIQQLFYTINFLHDWFYDTGFDEAAGNAQLNNYGRGGLGNDSMKAQVQDFAGFNNANMLTPADGARPRMRMYNFPSPANHLELIAAGVAAGKYQVGISMTGTQTFDVTTDIVRATFANTPTACTVTNAAALAGKIAMFDFDNTDGTGCAFSTRIARLSASGVAATLMVYTSASPAVVANITGFNATHTKPIATIAWNTGQLIKTQLATPATVNARLLRAPDRDGALDTQIVTHEWFHYLTNRLVGNGTGLGTNHASGLGEGWSDFGGLLLTVRENDSAVAGNASFEGVYAVGTYATSGAPYNGSANHAYYFASRRYPYSTDMTKNPLTFRHITNNVALPPGPPVLYGADGVNNAEVHATGEVWAVMLWECYAGLLRDTLGPSPRLTFIDAQNRMKQYLVSALKVTPVSPTLTEARDALLAVAYASDINDYIVFRYAFAKRGAGIYAVAPDRYSTDNSGVVEDFATGADLGFVSATIDDTLASCDSDGVVDHGEYGRISVTLRNVGTVALSATTATVSSPSADVWFPSGTALTFPAMQPGASATVSLRFAYVETVTGVQQVDFKIDYNDPQLGAPRTKTVGFRTNTDDILAASATETVEANASAWTTGFSPTFGNVAPWQRLAVAPLARVWHIDNAGVGSDQYLISPVFTVDGSGSVNVQLDHSWSFESDATANYDGGVIEMSVNSGAWTDIGTPAYNGTLINYAGNVNPLKTRQAFVKSSAGVVHTSLNQAIAPGSIVQFRFRAGTDSAGAATGWDIDNIAFTGVVETPFAVLVADSKSCSEVPTDADVAITVDDGVTSVVAGGSVSYTIVAVNNGPDDLIGATVADSFSSDLTCTWTCVASAGAACSASGSGNIADAITLPVAGSATYTASCTVSNAATSSSLANTATIAPPGPVADPNLANNSATDTDTLIRQPSHLIGDKTVSGSFVDGGTVTYTIVLMNDGQGIQLDNGGDELTDVLPAELTLVSASATSGTTVATLGTNTVTWNGAIAAGGSVTITITATIDAAAGTKVSNQATFAYDSHGTNTNDATGTTDAYRCVP